MSAAQVYKTLGVDPLPPPGRAWLKMGAWSRRAALARHKLPETFDRREWRDLPPRIRQRLTDAYAARR